MQPATLSKELPGSPGLGKTPERAPGGRVARDLQAAGSPGRCQGAELRLGYGELSQTLGSGNPSRALRRPKRGRHTPGQPGAVGPAHWSSVVPAASATRSLPIHPPSERRHSRCARGGPELRAPGRPRKHGPAPAAGAWLGGASTVPAGGAEDCGGRGGAGRARGVPRLQSRKRALLLERRAGFQELAALGVATAAWLPHQSGG